MSNKTVSRLTIALGLALMTACAPSDQSTISVSGSSTVLPVVSTAAERYSEQNTDIRVIVNAGGSGVGVSQLGSGQSDIGMISRDITPSEIAQYPDVEFTVHAIGRDAVVPVVSSELFDEGIVALTQQNIADIYTGTISNWSALGGPDREILVIDKEASRGTRQVFMAYVLGDSDAVAPGADLVLGSNNEEQTAITQSDSAIGMLSFAWLNDDVKGVSIELADGTSVTPTLDTISDGSFPISRNLVVITRQDSSAAALRFVDYLLSDEGQAIVEETGYVRVAN